MGVHVSIQCSHLQSVCMYFIVSVFFFLLYLGSIFYCLSAPQMMKDIAVVF